MEEGLSNVAYFRTDGGNPKLYTQEYVDKQKREIEQLRLELSGYRQAILQDKEMLGLKQEIEKLKKENNYYLKKINEISTLNSSLRSDRDKYKNIIKEVREYIEPFYEDALDYTEFKEILEILDKVSDKE